MFGHKWEPAHGTITGLEPDPRQHHDLVYVVDVPTEGGAGLQVRIVPPRSMGTDLPPGTQVRVEVNAKTGEVRFASNPVEGFSPGQIASPAGPVGGLTGLGSGMDTAVNEMRAAALGDLSEIVNRLGGEAAGNAVAAALANLGPGLTGGPAQPGGPGAPEVHVTTGNPEVRMVSGAEAAEMMREFFGHQGQASGQLGQVFGRLGQAFGQPGQVSGQSGPEPDGPADEV